MQLHDAFSITGIKVQHHCRSAASHFSAAQCAPPGAAACCAPGSPTSNGNAAQIEAYQQWRAQITQQTGAIWTTYPTELQNL